ncbi:PQQ-dependent sugar dehydrogenase [Chroococcidiopsis thermalis]|uniref:Glucose sorbosone dehydrogenase n=1 Tax=Chroococcidiopsis thermalis (strain PCC 7203) TaxID=251229 RepID=K9U4W1_CHRTP|nr:sorbosone dehydrogenase family protein [Chroococcidiopsis thermalis]AFY89673.1 glucose sorbosone dehydrogenase [Chroococcidiopsis thermalis PCC 7203]PSB41842.1 sorbosone dehydrogenase family protein [Cyanosarcina cf. burmensis CCALA 770]
MKLNVNLGWIFFGCTLLIGIALPASSQQPQQQQIERMEGYLATPQQLKFDESLLKQLNLPAGFEINVFAKDLGNPRNLAIAPDGTIYVTRREEGDILALRDSNKDGRADTQQTVASGFPYANGITIRQNRLYFVTDRELYVADLRPGGKISNPQQLIGDLPDGGQHPNRTLAFGPDGALYVSVGSSCNACDESNEEHATMLRVQPDGSKRTIFARGLRNTIPFGWHPQTGEFWGLDHGTDWRGNDQPPEELNLIQAGQHYGWPFCWGDRQPDVYLSADPEGTTKKEFCAKTEPPVLTYTAHSAPLAMVFYTASQFPAEYRNDAFVTMRGSWNRNPPVGYKVVRLRYENGKPVAFEDFITGFLNDKKSTQFGRPVGIATAPDGSLLFTDDTNGVIYRVSYTGNKQATHQQ